MNPASWVCDGCMRQVTATEIAVWADYEHVLCCECDRRESEQSGASG
jgi:hypothetical protein